MFLDIFKALTDAQQIVGASCVLVENKLDNRTEQASLHEENHTRGLTLNGFQLTPWPLLFAILQCSKIHFSSGIIFYNIE